MPVSRPIIDIEEVIKRKQELNLPTDLRTKLEHRLLGSLKVNLGLARGLASSKWKPSVSEFLQSSPQLVCNALNVLAILPTVLSFLGCGHMFSIWESTFSQCPATSHLPSAKVVTKIGLSTLHTDSLTLNKFLAEFNDAKNNSLKTALSDCIWLCYDAWTQMHVRRPIPRLLELFVGIPEDSPEVDAGKFGEIVVINGLLTAPLPSLLYDPVLLTGANQTVEALSDLLNSCRSRLLDSLNSDTDPGSGKVLECSFICGLAMRSAMQNGLALGRETVSFRCAAIKAGRIFVTGRKDVLMVDGVQANVLYYADEKKTPHPAADMWFLAGDGQLVLVEIGGTGAEEEAKKKVTAMTDVLSQHGAKNVIGVVLLPNFSGRLRPLGHGQQKPVVLSGLEAQRLLGGLAQMLTWLGDDLGDDQEEEPGDLE